MVLAAGTKIGPYEILALIGAGGMGEVYRAKDTKLKRDVALKVLPEAFASDAERMARFQREAEVLASLNHPNIAHVYGIEDRAIVMELVDGEMLSGPLPLDAVLLYARQIAEALEYAHERGVIHRDLKPANIKVTAEGVIKLLDFGLAKAIEDPAPGDDPSMSPTLTLGATRMGVIMGTAAYMSPEQASGKPADRRADIWAFGAVLYELFSGKKAFEGESVSDTLATVLKLEPDWQALANAAPVSIQKLIRRCLVKDRRRRLQAIGEARIAIEESATEPVSDAARIAPAPRLLPLGLVWIAVTVLAVALALWSPWRAPLASEVVRFQVPQPEKANFGPNAPPALSPDGRKLAFLANAGVNQVWIRSLDTLEARPLPGTDGAAGVVFWSPDSRSVAYWTAPGAFKLKRVEIAGGPTQSLCDTPASAATGAWSRDGVIIFHTEGLTRVPAGGGACTPLTKLDASRGESAHRLPFFLPDGRHFLYLRVSSRPENTGIYVGSLDTKPEQQSTERILATDSGAQYVPSRYSKFGYLLFTREGTLMAQPFYPGTLRFGGDALPVAEQIASGGAPTGPFFSASASGALAYRSGPSSALGNLRLTWLDQQGKILGTAMEPIAGINSGVAFSPDGTWAAFTRVDPQREGDNQDLWLYEFGRGSATRFTSDPALDLAPLWSPDGKEIVFASERDGIRNLYRKASNNAMGEELLLKSGAAKVPNDWSRDGRFLLFQSVDPKTGGDIFYLPMTGLKDTPPKPQVYLQTPSDEGQARFSPDGRFVAYVSNFSGNQEVYLQTFPDPKGGRWQVSKGGGLLPHWRRDGKELFYEMGGGQLMAVDVSLAPVVRIGTPKFLLQFPPGPAPFDVTGDGKKFMKLAMPSAGSNGPAAVTVVLNWQAGLKK